MRFDGLAYAAAGHSAELVGHLAGCFGNALAPARSHQAGEPEIVPFSFERRIADLGVRQPVGERGKVGVPSGNLRAGGQHAALERADIPTVLSGYADNVRFLVGRGGDRSIATKDVAARLRGPLFFGAGSARGCYFL